MAWLTPAEIFSPVSAYGNTTWLNVLTQQPLVRRCRVHPAMLVVQVYGAAVAALISKEHRLRAPGEVLNIIEIGGGTGTLAADILVRNVCSPESLPLACDSVQVNMSCSQSRRPV